MEFFEVEYKNEKLVIKIIKEEFLTTYMTTFASGDILFIKRGKSLPGDYYWTSFTNDDSEIAHDIILLIDQYLKTKKRYITN